MSPPYKNSIECRLTALSSFRHNGEETYTNFGVMLSSYFKANILFSNREKV